MARYADTIRKIYEAWEQSDPTLAFDHLDTEVVWEAIEDAPDAGTYRGHAGVKRYMDDWLEDFEDFAFEFGQLVDVNGRLVVEQRGRNKGKGSSLETEIHYAAVYTFSHGKVLTVKEYNSYADALQAVQHPPEPLDLVSRFNDSWARQDLDGVLACVAEDFVFDWSESRSPFKGVYRGHEGLMQYWADQVEVWEEFGIEEVETISIDADRLVSVNKVRGLGKTSRIVMEAVGAMLWTAREGKLRSAKLCQSKDDALEAAGVHLA